MEKILNKRKFFFFKEKIVREMKKLKNKNNKRRKLRIKKVNTAKNEKKL